MSLPTPSDHELTTTLPAQLRFWGVRHGIPAPGKETVEYGGNTPCLEVKIGHNLLVFDGGTGIRELGNHLLTQMPCNGHIFFTHANWDRIQGFPFFMPAFVPGNSFEIYGVAACNGLTIKELLTDQMTGPNFPVPIAVMASNLIFHDLAIEEKTYIKSDEPISIDTMMLNDQYHSIAYRVKWPGQSLVYATDIHSNWSRISDRLVEFVKGANILVIDAPEYLLASSATHDKFLQLVDRLGETSEVNTIIVSLHRPDYDDNLINQLVVKSKQASREILFAKEGQNVNIQSYPL